MSEVPDVGRKHRYPLPGCALNGQALQDPSHGPGARRLERICSGALRAEGLLLVEPAQPVPRAISITLRGALDPGPEVQDQGHISFPTESIFHRLLL